MTMPVRRNEEGMALITVILALSVLLVLAVAAIDYGIGSEKVSKRDQDWQSALSAAEAGLDNYQYHLNENANYTVYSATNPPPDGNLAFSQYVNIPGGNTNGGQYRYTADTSQVGVDGTITVTSTGKVGQRKRTIQSVVRRRSFLDYLYFTDYETQDPASYSNDLSDGSDPALVCNRHFYDSPARNSRCNDIQFISADTLNGPVHSNDAIMICGSPSFRGTTSTSWNTTGTRYRSNCGGTNPTFANPGDPRYLAPLSMPPSNSAIKAETTTTAGGCLYTGPTRIKLLSSGKMTVKSPFSKQTNNSCPTNGTTQGSLPRNGVIYVQNVPATSSDPNYTNGCPYNVNSRTHPLGLPIANDNTIYGCRNGDVFIEGTLKGQLTVAADNNIDITWNLTYNSGTGGTDLLGLVANNYIEIWHPVQCTSGSNSSCNLDANFPGETARNAEFDDATVQAAILAVNHSFRVQNYNLGAPLGTLTVNGAIAQRYRGAVGTGSGGSVSTGFGKNYNYDQRLKYQSPPKFLAPIAASWAVAVWKEIPVPAGM
jgi:Tfp pilus assembly protein PilX